jgi:uncharacterized membrane protein YqhA
MERLLLSARYLINLAVLAALVGAAAILIYGALVTIHVIGLMFMERAFSVEASKEVALSFIEVIDLLFLGVVLYITALGLYHLFINSTIHLPRWLKIEEFEELKVILIGVVIVLLAVNFTGQVVTWDGTNDILSLGIAIGLVIASIGLILYVRNYKLAQALPETTAADHRPES